MMEAIFSEIELEISFDSITVFYRNIEEKRVGKRLYKISAQPACRNALISLKEAQNKAKIELSLDMISKHALLYLLMPD